MVLSNCLECFQYKNMPEQYDQCDAGMNFSKPLECKAHSKREKFIPEERFLIYLAYFE